MVTHSTNPAKPFLAKESFIGLVAVGLPKSSSLAEGPDLEQIGKWHKRIFPDDPCKSSRNGSNPQDGIFRSVQGLFGASPSIKWMLSNHMTKEGPGQFYQVDLHGGYRGIVVYSEISEDLSVPEIIEMVCLLKGAPERINPDRGKDACVMIGAHTYRESIKEMLDDFIGERRFIVPVVAVNQLSPTLNSAEEVMQWYAPQIAEMNTLWLKQGNLLKSSYLTNWGAKDAHPFEYGLTFFSPVCTVEIHPDNTDDPATSEGIDESQLHRKEWTFLTGLLLVMSLQRVSMESDSAELDDQLKSQMPWDPVRGLIRLKQLSALRRAIARRLDVYAIIRVARREYMNEILDNARKAFLLDELYGIVRTKLADLSEDITSNYNAWLTAFATLLTLFALGFTIFQFYTQCQPPEPPVSNAGMLLRFSNFFS